jgi:hypothetical protein
MFELTTKRILIGLAILAGVILLIAIICMTIHWSPYAEHEGGILSIPKTVKKEGDPQPIEIVIPKGYTVAQMTELGKKFEAKVKPENYDPKFLDAFWAAAVAFFTYQRMFEVEVKVKGEFTPVINEFTEKNEFGFFVLDSTEIGKDSIGKGRWVRYTVPPDLGDDAKVAETKENLKTKRSTTGPASTFQSAGEGGCPCSKFKPFASVGPAGESDKIFYGPMGGDISDSLLKIHKRGTERHQGSGYEKIPEKTMLRGPKTIDSLANYYAWIPRVNHSHFVGDPTDMDLRPSTPDMRLHQMGPYDEFPLYSRPTSDRMQVMDTE